jgi:hypothetical protein
LIGVRRAATGAGALAVLGAAMVGVALSACVALDDARMAQVVQGVWSVVSSF